jgi:hypothetical protein
MDKLKDDIPGLLMLVDFEKVFFTDENTFTKLNSISVILLMKTRLQN